MADKVPDGQGVLKSPSPADRQLATFHALARQDAPKGTFVKVPPKQVGVTHKPGRVNSADDGPRATLKAKLGKLSPGRRKKLAAALKRKQGKA